MYSGQAKTQKKTKNGEKRECNHPTCGKTCRKKKEKKARKPLPRATRRPNRVSQSRKELLAIYIPLALKFRQDHPFCEIRAPGCTKFTEGVNHKAGKVGLTKEGIPLLIAVQYFEAGCNWCNGYCERNHAWAVENRHRISKYSV